MSSAASVGSVPTRIRPYRPLDSAACYQVCLETGDSGRDGTHLFDDPVALGEIYVGPYLRFEPDLAHVLEDARGVCGYVLAALDSGLFWRRYREEWLPWLQQKHPEPVGDPTSWTNTQRLYWEYHHPQVHYPESFSPYPSHLHIDLMERAQRRGWGARMVLRVLDQLAALGSPGVHLGMSAVNLRAKVFYEGLGFTLIDEQGPENDRVLYYAKFLQPKSNP